MVRRAAALLGLIFVSCNPPGRAPQFAVPPPPIGGGPDTSGNATNGNATNTNATNTNATAATPIPAPVITRGRGAWKSIAAPPKVPFDREPTRGLAVGRTLLAHHPGSGWLASYDPCKARWQPHEAIPQPLQRVAPLALDDTHAAICCGPPDRSGLLVDVTTAKPRAIPSMPQTPWPGRQSQVLSDGFLVPTDKRFVTRTGAWQVIAFDDAVYEAAGQQGSAVASSGTHVLTWGGDRWDDETGSAKLYPGGAVFDARKSAWRLAASRGAPSPRHEAAVVWTGTEFFVYGGQGIGTDGRPVTLTDGGRYDPATDRWQPVRGGPVFEGPVAGIASGGSVILWDAQRGAVHELRSGTWRELGLPARVAVQDRPFGAGRLAVLTDTHAFVLDPVKLSWAEHALPKAMRGRNQRVQVMTASHLIVWGGERITGSGGCENPPPDQGCDPWVTTKAAFDGAALALGSCR